MKQYSILHWLTIITGILTLASLPFSFLALTDITHGEKDLSAEWAVLRITAIVILLFIVSIFFTVHKFIRCTRKKYL